MKAIILAGGRGTRLQGRVPDVPKPMAPVAGRPFLAYLLDQLVRGGVTEVILSVGYKADMIQRHFGSRYQKATIRYSFEAEPLGTGGAIVHALQEESMDPVLIINGDTFVNIDYDILMQAYGQNPALLLMVLREVSDVSRYGCVKVDRGRVIGYAEKNTTGSGYINTGVYIVDPMLFSLYRCSDKFSLEADLLAPHCKTLKPIGFFTNEYFIDIGVPVDYERAQHELPEIVTKQ